MQVKNGNLYLIYILLGVIGIMYLLWPSPTEPVIDRTQEAKLYVLINGLTAENKDLKKSALKDSIEITTHKEVKTRIIYKTRFDTLATVDTIYVELIKCDSIVRLDSVIIGKQDHQIKTIYTVIENQDKIITSKESLLIGKDSEIKAKDKALKKEHRKVIFTKIVAVVGLGVVIVLSLL